MPAQDSPPSAGKSILILNRTFPPMVGATGRMACDLALYLRKFGHHITVIATGEEAKTNTAKNLTVMRVKANQSPQTVRDYLKITKAMKKAALKQPAHDVVISMTDPPLQALEAQKIASKMKARHIHWAMDLYPDLLPVMGKTPSKAAYRWADKKMHKTLKNADVIVPISKCMARYMAHRSLPRHKMTIIENWADHYLLDNRDEDTPPLLDEPKFRILYAGTIGLAHDFESVFKVAHYFQKNNPEIEFVFTAQGRGLEDFLHRRKQLDLKNIRMIKPQSAKNLTNLMATGDLHLITMKDGAAGMIFPSKFYAAMAASRPVLFVGPEECDLHDKILKYHLGVSVRTDDAQGLAKAILHYMNDPEDWFTDSGNAARFSAAHAPLEEWKDLIASLL